MQYLKIHQFIFCVVKNALMDIFSFIFSLMFLCKDVSHESIDVGWSPIVEDIKQEFCFVQCWRTTVSISLTVTIIAWMWKQSSHEDIETEKYMKNIHQQIPTCTASLAIKYEH